MLACPRSSQPRLFLPLPPPLRAPPGPSILHVLRLQLLVSRLLLPFLNICFFRRNSIFLTVFFPPILEDLLGFGVWGLGFGVWGLGPVIAQSRAARRCQSL